MRFVTATILLLQTLSNVSVEARWMTVAAVAAVKEQKCPNPSFNPMRANRIHRMSSTTTSLSKNINKNGTLRNSKIRQDSSSCSTVLTDEEADVGVLNFGGYQEYSTQDLSAIYPPITVCNKNHDDFNLYDCDCNDFDYETRQGSFSCITKDDFCLSESFWCGYNEITNTITDDGELHSHYCYYLDEPYNIDVCYSTYSPVKKIKGKEESCAIHVQAWCARGKRFTKI